MPVELDSSKCDSEQVMELDTLTHDDDDDDDKEDYSEQNGIQNHIHVKIHNIEDDDDNYSDEKTLL